MSQTANKFLHYIRRGTAKTAEAEAREPEAREARDRADTRGTRYDKLSAEEVVGHLDELTPAGLATLDRHERAHQNRPEVLARIHALLNTEPWPGYDQLDVPAVRAALDIADREQLDIVLAYERARRNRADVLLAAQQAPNR